MLKLLEWLICEPGERIVRVKCWCPSIGRHGLEWPTVLMDTRAGRRQTAAPVWDRARLRQLFGREVSSG